MRSFCTVLCAKCTAFSKFQLCRISDKWILKCFLKHNIHKESGDESKHEIEWSITGCFMDSFMFNHLLRPFTMLLQHLFIHLFPPFPQDDDGFFVTFCPCTVWWCFQNSHLDHCCVRSRNPYMQNRGVKCMSQFWKLVCNDQNIPSCLSRNQWQYHRCIDLLCFGWKFKQQDFQSDAFLTAPYILFYFTLHAQPQRVAFLAWSWCPDNLCTPVHTESFNFLHKIGYTLLNTTTTIRFYVSFSTRR